MLDAEAIRLQAMTAATTSRVFEGERDEPQGRLPTRASTRRDLVIACTSRDEVNLVAGMFARRRGAQGATTVIRTSSVEYIQLWRGGQLDVDFVVSSELETAHAISRDHRRARGAPDRRLRRRAGAGRRVRRPSTGADATARRPAAPRGPRSRTTRGCSAIIRGDSMILPRGGERLRSATGSS